MELVYKSAAEVLGKLQRREGSLKSLIFNKKLNGPVGLRKQVYAVAAETLKCKPVLLKIIEASHLLDKEPELTINLALVLTHDLLFGKGVKCRGQLKQYVVKHGAELKQYQKALAKDRQRSDPARIPRYVRINLLKTSVYEVVTRMELDGYIQEELSCLDMEFQDRVFHIDNHLSDVLVFHSSATLTSHPLYHESHIILQDKASCLPAHLLAPPPGSKVIDCCAAPGNKTTHLASLMNNHGKIHAFDKDPERFAVLENRLKKAGATCVSPVLRDFLQVNPDDYYDTEYILVDPSCSGSGIANRLDYHDFEVNTHRLKRLSSFQLKILKHALEFPLVKKVVYSTCSVHKEENEMVVQRALHEFHSSFVLENAMPEWTGRGLPLFDGGKRCLRASPQESATNGFFIAVFLRKDLDAKVLTYRPDIAKTQQHILAHTSVHMALKKGQKKRRKRRRKLPVTNK